MTNWNLYDIINKSIVSIKGFRGFRGVRLRVLPAADETKFVMEPWSKNSTALCGANFSGTTIGSAADICVNELKLNINGV